MKVLFSNPPWWSGQQGATWIAGVRAGSRWPFTLPVRCAPDQFKPGDYCPYPFFMGYAATYVREKTGADVQFRDSIGLRESYQTYFNYLNQHRFDYIFIESATPSWEIDSQIIRNINKFWPESKIVLTGPITVTKSDEILRDYPVHACIRGEYEKGSARVVNGESGIIDFDMLTTEEMNKAPFPYFAPEYLRSYWDANPRGQVFPHAQVWSSRGCPFKCIFCVWPATMTGNDPDGNSKRTVRYYSADYMEAFLKEWVSKYPFRCIYFDDDTFNLGNKHTVEMCKVMEKIKLPWSAMCRADSCKLETWQLMKDSGCFGVKIGFESGSQFVVDKIVNKHLDLEYAANVVRHCKSVGLTVHGTFTYGLPGETKEQMLETKKYIQSLPFDTIQESGTAEIEGTPLHTLREKGHLDAYEGAVINDTYRRETDGNRKWQSLVAELQAH